MMTSPFCNPDKVWHYTQTALDAKSFEALPDVHFYVEYWEDEWGYMPLNEVNTDMPIVFSSLADLEHGIDKSPLLWWLEDVELRVFVMNASQRTLPKFGYCRELVIFGRFNGETWQKVEI